MQFFNRHITALCLTTVAAAAAPAQASDALVKKHGCLGCHAASAQLVGPSYQAVAAKYGNDKATVAMLAASIRKGGSGKWGETAMPPQAQLPEADAKRMATWILGGAK